MKQVWKNNLKDALIRTINQFSPDYIGTKGQVDPFFTLVDDIEEFEDGLESTENCDPGESDYWAHDIENDKELSEQK